MRITVLLVLMLFARFTWAQNQLVPIKEKSEHSKNSINREHGRADTISVTARKDSLRIQVADSIKRMNPFTRFKSKGDSLKQSFHRPDTLGKIGFNHPAFIDSVRQIHLPHPGNRADSLKVKMNDVSGRAAQKSAGVQDAIKTKADSLKAGDELKPLQEKLRDAQNGLSPRQQLKLSAADNPGIATHSFTDAVKIPGTDISKGAPIVPDSKLPGQQINFPETGMPNRDVTGNVKDNLPSADLPNLTQPDSAQLNVLKEKAFENEQLKKYAEPVDEVSEKINPYKNRLDSLTIQDAGEIAVTEGENVLENTEAMEALDGKMNEGKAALAMPQQAALLQRYQDKKLLKEEMLRKSKNVMNDKLTSLSPQITDQQKKFGKVKKLNSSVPSVKNMKEKRHDELKDKPFYERIVPGISIQSHMGDVFAMDFGPQVSYRVTTPLSFGAGVLYRVGFDKQYPAFVSGQGVFGYRTFLDYRVIKGLFIHGEFEKISTTRTFAYSDKVTQANFNNMYLGLGKRYPISRKLYGSLIALYKIEMNDHLPGTTRFNVRVLLEYKTKKVRKPTDL